MNIIGLKLITGEDVVGEVESETEDVVILVNPVGLAVMRGADGVPNIGFTPFPLHGVQKKDAEIILKKKHIIYQYDPAEDYKENYNQVFGSGIVVPNKQIITG